MDNDPEAEYVELRDGLIWQRGELNKLLDHVELGLREHTTRDPAWRMELVSKCNFMGLALQAETSMLNDNDKELWRNLVLGSDAPEAQAR